MILVTGSAGFIGKKLCKALEEKGEEIFLYDIQHGQDVRDYFLLNKVFRENNFDTVIHLAARAGVRTSKEFPDEYISTNIQGTYNVLRCAEQYGVKVVFFSSSSVFGSQNPPNVESTPIQPESLYAITKATGEMMCKNSTAKTVAVRPFTVYGENGRKDQVIFKWLNCYKAGKLAPFFGDGKTKRGYTYVGDLVNAIVALLKLPEEQWPEAINLGGKDIITLEMLADIFVSVIPDFKAEKLPLPNGDVVENYADTTLAKNLLELTYTDFADKVKEIISNELE